MSRRATLNYPTPWSDWEWNKRWNTYSRYRLPSRAGDYEYQYHENPSETQKTSNSTILPANLDTIPSPQDDVVSCTHSTCSQVFQSTADRDQHVKEMHLNGEARPFPCAFEECSAGVQSWTNMAGLRKHNTLWHGPYPCQVSKCKRGIPNGFSSRVELDNHVSRDHGSEYTISVGRPSGRSASPARELVKASSEPVAGIEAIKDEIVQGLARIEIHHNVKGSWRPGSRDFEKFDHSYRVHKGHEFRQFRVFKVLWSEPQGSAEGHSSHDTISVRLGKSGEQQLQKVRRFLIIQPMEGHCLCLPINTYLKQGVNKRGVQAHHHTIVYTHEPQYLEGERKKGLTRKPIKIEMSGPQPKLDESSRLNYAKIYTVEHNIKVFFIGKVHKDFRHTVVAAYNEVHPILSYGGVASGQPLPQSTFDHATGGTIQNPSVAQQVENSHYPHSYDLDGTAVQQPDTLSSLEIGQHVFQESEPMQGYSHHTNPYIEPNADPDIYSPPPPSP